jgi:hypothetical protein
MQTSFLIKNSQFIDARKSPVDLGNGNLDETALRVQIT